MQPDSKFTFACRFKLLLWAAFLLALGLGLIFYSFTVFSYMVFLLPWALTAGGILLWTAGVIDKRHRNYRKIISGAVIFCGGIVLFRWSEWRDAALWYIFAGYLIISAWHTFRPVLMRGVERQPFARTIGALTVWSFAGLMLFMPRSGLSDALTLLGIFTAAWGAFQLLLPPVRE